MTVQLKFFAGLRDHLPGKKSPYSADVPDGTTVGDVMRLFRIPEDKPRIVLVNGRHSTAAEVLREGDVLSLFPPVAGG